MYKVSDNDFKRGDTMMVSCTECTTTVCYTTVQGTNKQTHKHTNDPHVTLLRGTNKQTHKHTNHPHVTWRDLLSVHEVLLLQVAHVALGSVL